MAPLQDPLQDPSPGRLFRTPLHVSYSYLFFVLLAFIALARWPAFFSVFSHNIPCSFF